MKGYKILTAKMKSPFDNKTKWKVGGITKVKEDNPLVTDEYGLHLYRSLKNVTEGRFGPRVFEAKPIGKYLVSQSNLCAYKVKLLRELSPSEVKDSQWAFLYCKEVENDPEVAENITEDYWILKYGEEVGHSLEVAKKIKNPQYAFDYCKYVHNDARVAKLITDSKLAYRYCTEVINDPNVAKNITSRKWKRRYNKAQFNLF